MADNIKNKPGTGIGNQYLLLAKQPIDARYVVKNIAERDSIISEGAGYPGLAVWVEAENKKYEWNGTTWHEATIPFAIPITEGETKTLFRASAAATNDPYFAPSTPVYYPLCKLPIIPDSNNYASAHIAGRIGGWESYRVCHIDATITNRAAPSIASLLICNNTNAATLQNSAIGDIFTLTDIVCYTNDDSTVTIYLKARSWFIFDLNIELYQKDAELLFDGTYLSEIPGTESATLSTSQNLLMLANGKAQVKVDNEWKSLVDEKLLNDKVKGFLPFDDTYIDDLNTWQTNGYKKVSSSSTHHPIECRSTDRWGILFFIAENAKNGTGSQIYYPIDGPNVGRMYVRSILVHEPVVVEGKTDENGWYKVIYSTDEIEAASTKGTLTFTGATTGTFNGSENKTINIPTITGPKGDKGDTGSVAGIKEGSTNGNVITSISLDENTNEIIYNRELNAALETDLDNYIPVTQKGIASGVASLDENGHIPASQLPGSVNEYVEYDTFEQFPNPGEADRIYLAINTNKSYRWTGSTYAVIGNDLALGTTANTAYEGSKGKANADNIAAIIAGTQVVGKANTLTEETTNNIIDTARTGYATEAWVSSQNYLTEIPNNSITDDQLVSKNFVKKENLKDLGTEYFPIDLVTETELNTTLNNYVTDTALENKHYITDTKDAYTYTNLKGIPQNLATVDWVTKFAKAHDSDLLDGKDSTYFLNYNNLSNKPNLSKYIPYGAAVQTTNPFGGKKLYINKIDNAFYVADKRWLVTATDITNPEKPVAIGGTKYLFDGSYESALQRIAAGHTAKISIDFRKLANGEPNPVLHFPEYPYGYIYVSFYYTSIPLNVTARMYSNYSAHGIGWHDLAVDKLVDGNASTIYRIHQTKYNMEQLEIIVTAPEDHATSITQIEINLDRPSPERQPVISKYKPEVLYYNLDAPSFSEEGVKLIHKYLTKTDKAKYAANADSAGTADKTRGTLTLTGAVSPAVSFNGSESKTINIPTIAGPKGDTGPKGDKGDPGEKGKDGQNGIQGEPGKDGVSVSSITKTSTSGLVDTYTIKYSDNKTTTFDVTNGKKGDTGAAGHTPVITIDSNGNWIVDGKDTEIKATGPQGDKGDTGLTGPQGPQGEQGPQGIQGLKGDKGDQGLPGENGAPGKDGIQGPVGPAGPEGSQGLQGDKGEPGQDGQPGPQGPKGDKGEKGDPGSVAEIKVDTTANTGNAITSISLDETTKEVTYKKEFTFAEKKELDSYILKTEKGQINGVATLDEGGHIPTSQLPGSVNEYEEYDNKAAFPQTGAKDKIYLAKDTNKSYRWTGTDYHVIGSDLALGETNATAYAGDKGKKNAEDIATLKSTKVDADYVKEATVKKALTSDTTIQLKSTDTGGKITVAPVDGGLIYQSRLYSNTAGLFPTSNNANGIITFNKHPGAYNSQLGFNNQGKIYYRNFDGKVLDNTTPWKRIYMEGDDIEPTKINGESVGTIIPEMGVPRGNLGNPSIFEMACIDQEWTNKTDFMPVDNITVESSTDGITFVPYELEPEKLETLKKKLVGGDAYGDFIIQGGQYLRITITPRSYVYLNALYLYQSTNGSRHDYKIEQKKQATQKWETVKGFNERQTVSDWPGHVIIRHNTIPFTTTAHNDAVRLTIHNTIDKKASHVYKLQWWGGYPYGQRNIWATDENKNITFPATATVSKTAKKNLALTANGDIKVSGNILEGNQWLKDKYALKCHSHKFIGTETSGSVSVKPTGTISIPTINLTKTHETVTEVLSKGTLPELTSDYEEATQKVSLIFKAGTLMTTADLEVLTDAVAESTQPIFTGNEQSYNFKITPIGNLEDCTKSIADETVEINN